MIDKVFSGTVVLPDRIIENGYVLVGDGLVQSVGSGALPEGEKHGGGGFFFLSRAPPPPGHHPPPPWQGKLLLFTTRAASRAVPPHLPPPYFHPFPLAPPP